MINPDEVAERVTRIRGEIAQRGQHAVSLVAVTKSFGLDAIHAAVHARCDAIGENYAQELLDKVALQLPNIDVHFIGGIQSNKVKALAPHVALWQSVDKESVVKELAKRAPGAQVLLQVNTTGEGTKGGVAPSELELLLGQASDLGLGVRGLMTLGPPTDPMPKKDRLLYSCGRLPINMVSPSARWVCLMTTALRWNVARP